MKNSFNYLTKWGLSLFILLLVAGVWCQNLYSQVRDIRQEVLVYILPDSLELPTGEVRDVSPDRAIIQSETLSQALQQLPVQALDRAFPELTDADTIRVREDGVSVKLPQWSRVFIVRLDSRQAVGEALETLGDEPGVLFAEPHTDMGLDDHLFAQQWHLNNTGQTFGTPGADIDALDAWNIFTGSSSVRLAVVDTGVETNHVDLSGNASGDQPDAHPFVPYGHGTHVAGIAGAAHNQGHVRGVDDGAEILSRAVFEGFFTDDDGIDRPQWVGNNTAYNRIVDAVDSGANVLNNSYSGPQFSTIMRSAFAYAYKMNRVSVATMGNLNSFDPRYPAAFGQGVVAVGATTHNDVRWVFDADNGSNFGNHISVSAPGALIMSTERDNGHGHRTGTSMAAPIVSGIATLLKGYDSSLYNDDIQRLIELSADDIDDPNDPTTGPGWDEGTGHGRVNAHQALLRLQSPYILDHNTASNGVVHNVSGSYGKTMYGIPGLADGTYSVKRHEVRKSVSFPWMDEGYVWGRGAAATGYSAANPNFGMGYTDVISSSENSALLRTYVYEVSNLIGQFIGWFPTTPQNAEFAYTVHGIPGDEPLSAEIGGDFYFGEGNPGQWDAVVSGGEPPYSYTWFRSYSSSTGPWTQVGTSSSYGQMVNEEMWLRLSVTDNTCQGMICLGQQDIAHIQVDSCGNPPCPMPKAPGGGETVPEAFALSQNYPNPFNPSTTISYDLPEQADVRMEVFNMLGQRVALLADGKVQPGSHTAVFDASNLSSGTYLARISVHGNSGQQFVQTMTMQLVK